MPPLRNEMLPERISSSTGTASVVPLARSTISAVWPACSHPDHFARDHVIGRRREQRRRLVLLRAQNLRRAGRQLGSECMRGAVLLLNVLGICFDMVPEKGVR